MFAVEIGGGATANVTPHYAAIKLARRLSPAAVPNPVVHPLSPTSAPQHGALTTCCFPPLFFMAFHYRELFAWG